MGQANACLPSAQAGEVIRSTPSSQDFILLMFLELVLSMTSLT
jgi:hypothetical protein